ncbi:MULTISPECIES: hypothetical protein [Vibrio]|uniref:hypothetical protein n=1 Tax=Vibrio TaxID=662 RepID=UPI001BD4E498|nr:MULTISPECIES: hypothetical protein [Vibrio]MBT0044098.1 hypothetical protein [Vibrio alginolyticus]MBT0094937.1 hypothetical protein [Vibrio alginolyticus]MCC4218236.1 hypothetical protein [Vibrio parahaemolyticus]MDW1890788.1 hypothetical protein [Vibrio sp. Vb1574]HCM1361732.1 hypothetical protein [Vibrio parahaemolyticus]
MNIYLYAPSNTIPDSGTVQREILDLLWSVEKVDRQSLVAIDDTFRRYLQELGNERFGYWRIIRLYENGSRRITHVMLDRRHFEGQKQDQAVRAERRKELKMKSLQQAKNETKRLGKASKELEEALDYWDSLAKEEGPNL